MSKPICANLGFLMQISGLLTILPIAIGLALNETQTALSLFLPCVGFLGAGFLLNALCERKELDYKSSAILLVAAFIILPLIGALPYFYSDPFQSANVLDRLTNGYFESVSGFTTTGFSFISAPETLPQSMLAYRSLTELMGGVGIVFLLLAFFQSKKTLSNLGNSLGIDDINGDLKKTFLLVLAVYSLYILVFTAIFYALGFQNIIGTGAFVIDTITGGYTPSPEGFQIFLGPASKVCIIVLMLLGSLNFAFSYHLLTGKLKKMFSREAILYFAIIFISTTTVALTSNISVFDSFFHVVSMSSSTGYSYIPIADFNSTAISILILTMIIGGCSFSMAGGIRVSRLIGLAKSVKTSIKTILKKEHPKTKLEKQANENGSNYNLPVVVTILLFLSTLVIFAIIFTGIGVSFRDALFEVGSAITTNGISMGATNLAMPIGYKWLMITAMTIGRVEILSIVIAIISLFKRTKK